MKRPVSFAASLAVLLGTLTACGEAAVTKEQVATICSEKSVGALNCACFSDALAKDLTPEQFAKVARAIEDNRRFTGFLPASLGDDPAVGASLDTAQTSCTT